MPSWCYIIRVLPFCESALSGRGFDASLGCRDSLRRQVVNVPNSMTVLTDLLPVSLVMAERKLQVRDQDEQHPLATIDVRPTYVAGFAYKSSRTCFLCTPAPVGAPTVVHTAEQKLSGLCARFVIAGSVQLLQPGSDQPQRDTGFVQAGHRPDIRVLELHYRGAG